MAANKSATTDNTTNMPQVCATVTRHMVDAGYNSGKDPDGGAEGCEQHWAGVEDEPFSSPESYPSDDSDESDELRYGRDRRSREPADPSKVRTPTSLAGWARELWPQGRFPDDLRAAAWRARSALIVWTLTLVRLRIGLVIAAPLAGLHAIRRSISDMATPPAVRLTWYPFYTPHYAKSNTSHGGDSYPLY